MQASGVAMVCAALVLGLGNEPMYIHSPAAGQTFGWLCEVFVKPLSPWWIFSIQCLHTW